MARTGMANLILTVRGFCDAASADYTIGTSIYWTDDHIQTVLDRWRTDHRRLDTQPQATYIGGGTVHYTEYLTYQQQWESGTAMFSLQDSIGGTAPAYTLDAETGIITFTANTSGSAYFVTGRTYDIYGAAADVWQQKAANASKAFDFSTDNHNIKRSQLRTNAMEMSQYYRAMAEPITVKIYRDDLIDCGGVD